MRDDSGWVRMTPRLRVRVVRQRLPQWARHTTPAPWFMVKRRLRCRRRSMQQARAGREMLRGMAASGRGPALHRAAGRLLLEHGDDALQHARYGVRRLLLRCRLRTRVEQLLHRHTGWVRCRDAASWGIGASEMRVEVVDGALHVGRAERSALLLPWLGYHSRRVESEARFDSDVVDGLVAQLAVDARLCTRLAMQRLRDDLARHQRRPYAEPGGYLRVGDIRAVIGSDGWVIIERTGGPAAVSLRVPLAAGGLVVADAMHYAARGECVRCWARRIAGRDGPCTACARAAARPRRRQTRAATAPAPVEVPAVDDDLRQLGALLEFGQLSVDRLPVGVRGYRWTVAAPTGARANALWQPGGDGALQAFFYRGADGRWRIGWTADGDEPVCWPIAAQLTRSLLRLRAWWFGVAAAGWPPPMTWQALQRETSTRRPILRIDGAEALRRLRALRVEQLALPVPVQRPSLCIRIDRQAAEDLGLEEDDVHDMIADAHLALEQYMRGRSRVLVSTPVVSFETVRRPQSSGRTAEDFRVFRARWRAIDRWGFMRQHPPVAMHGVREQVESRLVEHVECSCTTAVLQAAGVDVDVDERHYWLPDGAVWIDHAPNAHRRAQRLAVRQAAGQPGAVVDEIDATGVPVTDLALRQVWPKRPAFGESLQDAWRTALAGLSLDRQGRVVQRESKCGKPQALDATAYARARVAVEERGRRPSDPAVAAEVGGVSRLAARARRLQIERAAETLSARTGNAIAWGRGLAYLAGAMPTKPGTDAPGLVQPFIKWVGGKRRLLPWILADMPERCARYVEPFVGGGAVLLELLRRGIANEAVAGDREPEIIRMWTAVQRDPAGVWAEIDALQLTPEQYYALRETDPADLDDVRAAARLAFLTRTAYRGIIRRNRRGQFNVGFGDADTLGITEEQVMAVSAAIQPVRFICAEAVDLLDAVRDATVYCDPPYWPKSESSSFVGYDGRGYGAGDLRRLVSAMERARGRGCHIMLSNNPQMPVFEILPDDWQVRIVSRAESLRQSGGQALEIVASGVPLAEAMEVAS